MGSLCKRSRVISNCSMMLHMIERVWWQDDLLLQLLVSIFTKSESVMSYGSGIFGHTVLVTISRRKSVNRNISQLILNF